MNPAANLAARRHYSTPASHAKPGAGGGRHRVHRAAARVGEPGARAPDAGPAAAGDRPGHRQAPDVALLQGPRPSQPL
jgi:hypothetical protein